MLRPFLLRESRRSWTSFVPLGCPVAVPRYCSPAPCPRQSGRRRVQGPSPGHHARAYEHARRNRRRSFPCGYAWCASERATSCPDLSNWSERAARRDCHQGDRGHARFARRHHHNRWTLSAAAGSMLLVFVGAVAQFPQPVEKATRHDEESTRHRLITICGR
jgi:hypothetical protein